MIVPFVLSLNDTLKRAASGRRVRISMIHSFTNVAHQVILSIKKLSDEEDDNDPQR
jgi:hypothetical protein